MKCNIRCWTAKSQDCVCQCSGKNHGIDRVPLDKEESFDRLKINREKKIHRLRGVIITEGESEIYLDEQRLLPDKSLKLISHSPTGFAWGYAGSGPAQLALAILLEFIPSNEAVALHQKFKFDFIAKLPEGQNFDVQFNIGNWLKINRPKEYETILE